MGIDLAAVQRVLLADMALQNGAPGRDLSPATKRFRQAVFKTTFKKNKVQVRSWADEIVGFDGVNGLVRWIPSLLDPALRTSQEGQLLSCGYHRDQDGCGADGLESLAGQEHFHEYTRWKGFLKGRLHQIQAVHVGMAEECRGRQQSSQNVWCRGYNFLGTHWVVGLWPRI